MRASSLQPEVQYASAKIGDQFEWVANMPVVSLWYHDAGVRRLTVLGSSGHRVLARDDGQRGQLGRCSVGLCVQLLICEKFHNADALESQTRSSPAAQRAPRPATRRTSRSVRTRQTTRVVRSILM